MRTPKVPDQATPPPHNLEAEQAVLGTLLLAVHQGDDDQVRDALACLTPDTFYPPQHRRIFEAFEALHRDGRSPNLVALTDELRQQGHLIEVGGPSYLTSLLDAAFSVSMLASSLAVLERDRRKRALRDLGGALWHGASNGQNVESLTALIDRVRDGMRGDGPREADGGGAVEARDLIADPTPAPAPIVEDLVLLGTISEIVAPAKRGKTQVVLQCACAIASGRPFLGLHVPAPVPVLYVGQEDTRWTLRDRLRPLVARFGPLRATFHVWATKGVLLEDGAKEIRAAVLRHRPRVLILDPLRRFHRQDEERGVMGEVIRAVDLLIRDFGLAVLLVAHTRKRPSEGRKRPLTLDDVRGHSVIVDQANTIALLDEGDEPATFTLTITGNFTERRAIRLRRVGHVFEVQVPHETLTAAEAVEAFADQPPMTRAEAVRILQSRGLSRSGAYAKVKALEAAGWLQPTTEGLTLNAGLVGVSPSTLAGASKLDGT